VRPGADGLRKVVYEVVLDGDREVTRTAVSSIVTKEPSPEVIYVGTSASATGRGRYGARGYFAGRRVVTMVATGYDPSPASNGGTTRTSTGIKVGHGLVAVDPRFIPMGTKLFIEGYGHAVAADVGGAIKGNRIDLGHDTARGARNVGRRTVRVHILN
jgi:3D (Asp-Asp-Asp) domain-containing protein